MALAQTRTVWAVWAVNSRVERNFSREIVEMRIDQIVGRRAHPFHKLCAPELTQDDAGSTRTEAFASWASGYGIRLARPLQRQLVKS
jgi:hypothetical protein